MRALENTNLDEVIATAQLPSTVTDDYLKTTWKLPRELRHRSFIVEVCTTDAATDQSECWLADQSGENQMEREGVYYSCPYYVSAIKASWLGKLTGNNDVELDSRVYCSHLAEGADEFSAKRRGARSRGGQMTELEGLTEGLKFDEEGVLVYKDGKLQTVDSSSLYSPTESDSSAKSAPTIIKQYYPVSSKEEDDDDDNEPQTLKLKGRKLKISDGNSVTLPLNDVESQTYPLADGSTDGVLSATDWNRFASKENSLTFDGSFMRDGDTIHLMTCPAGQIMKSTGSGFTCAEDIDTDTDTQYLAGSGLVLTGNAFSLDQQGAVDGQVLMWDDVSNSWSPATPATFANTDQQNLSYDPATGTVSIERGTGFTFPLSGGTQTNPSLLTATDWTTFNGKENVLTFADGLTRTGNNVQLMSCAADQVLQRNGAGNAWICANQVTDTNTTYTAGAGLSLTGTTFNNIGILGVSSTGALTTNVTSQNAALTLNTNSNFTQTGNQLDLSNTGVTAGAYNNVTVDEKGRVTAATNVSYLTSFTEQDGIIGNEVAGVVNNGGLVMTGAGTTADPYRVGLVTTCADGEILKYTTAGGWDCASDIDTTIPDNQTLTYNPANNQLTIADGNTVDLSNLNNSGTDDQQLSLAGNILTLEDGGTVDLTPYLDNTDTQDLSLATTPGTGDVVNSYQINLVDGGNITLQDTDTDTQYAAGDGLSLGAGNIFAVNAPTCTGTDKLVWNGTQFLCSSDVDTDTTYTAGSGLALAGTTFALSQQGATNGQVLTWNGTNWVPATPATFNDTDDQTLSYDSATNQLTIDDGNTVDLSNLNNSGTDDQQLSLTGNTLTLEDGGAVDLTPYLDDTDTQDLSLVTTPGTGDVVNGYQINLVDGGNVTLQDTDTQYTAGDGLELSAGNVLGIDSPTCTSRELLSWDGTDFQCVDQDQPPIIMPIDLDLNVVDVGAGGNGQANMHDRNYIAVAQDGQGFIHLDFRMKNNTGGSWNNPIGNFDPSWQVVKLSEMQTYEGGYAFAGYQQGVVHGGSQLIANHRYVVNIPVFVDFP